MWSVVEKLTIKSRHPNVASLRAAIEGVFTDKDHESQPRSCTSLRPRLDALIQAKADAYKEVKILTATAYALLLQSRKRLLAFSV